MDLPIYTHNLSLNHGISILAFWTLRVSSGLYNHPTTDAERIYTFWAEMETNS